MTIFICNSIMHIKNMHLLSQSVNLRQSWKKKMHINILYAWRVKIQSTNTIIFLTLNLTCFNWISLYLLLMSFYHLPFKTCYLDNCKIFCKNCCNSRVTDIKKVAASKWKEWAPCWSENSQHSTIQFLWSK